MLCWFSIVEAFKGVLCEVCAGEWWWSGLVSIHVGCVREGLFGFVSVSIRSSLTFEDVQGNVIDLSEVALVGSLFVLRMAMILLSFQILGILEC